MIPSRIRNMAHNGREEGYSEFGAGWVSSNMGISKLCLRKAVENMGVMLWWNDRREIKTTTTSQVHPTDQILCCMLTSEISVSLAMAGRAGGHSNSWEKNRTFTHMGRVKDVWKHVYPSPKGIFSLWTMGLPWPQDVFLGTISLPLFLPFSFYLRQTVCPNICSRPELWDPCP